MGWGDIGFHLNRNGEIEMDHAKLNKKCSRCDKPATHKTHDKVFFCRKHWDQMWKRREGQFNKDSIIEFCDRLEEFGDKWKNFFWKEMEKRNLI